MEYGIAIFRISKKWLRKLNSIQNIALCRMFSVYKNSSSKTLQMITGILPMENREKILKFKWEKRYGELEEIDGMLLPIIENYLNQNGITPRAIEIKNDLTSVNEFNENGNDITKIIKSYTNNIFENSKNDIKIMKDTPLRDIKNKEFYNIICGKIGERRDLQILALFLLNKIPGKPICCVKCSENINIAHLVRCNTTKWIELNETLKEDAIIKKEIETNNIFQGITSMWPFEMFKLIAKIKKGYQKGIVIKKFAETLRISLNSISGFSH